MNEYEFVELFKAYCNANKIICIQPMGKNQSIYADAEVLHKNIIVKLEAKLFNDIRNDSSKFYQAIGQIIGNRNKANLICNLGELYNVCYGFLIPKSAYSKFEDYWASYSELDRKNLVSYFDMKYLILFDVEKQEMVVKDLNNVASFVNA